MLSRKFVGGLARLNRPNSQAFLLRSVGLRFFSGRFMEDPSKKALLDDCPWLLGNTDHKLITAKEGAEPDLIEYFQHEGINRNANGLADGLRYTFVELWESLKERNLSSI